MPPQEDRRGDLDMVDAQNTVAIAMPQMVITRLVNGFF